MGWVIFILNNNKSSYLSGTGLFEGLYQFVQFLEYCSRTQLAHSGDHQVGQHLYVIVITETILNKYSSCRFYFFCLSCLTIILLSLTFFKVFLKLFYFCLCHCFLFQCMFEILFFLMSFVSPIVIQILLVCLFFYQMLVLLFLFVLSIFNQVWRVH